MAWKIDKLNDYRAVRHDIAAIKVLTPQVMHDVVQRSLQVHGALGTTNEMPLARMWQSAMVLGLVDGPTEVHKVTIARALLKQGRPAEGMWPTEWIPAKQEEARAKFAHFIEMEIGNQ